MTADEAEEHVLDLVECEVIPQPSLMGRSGRGVYVLYLFKEPLDVTDDVPFLWLGIVNRLLRRMQTLRMDEAACRTLNRLFKAPGTLDGRVIYTMVDDGTNDLRRYSLDDIEVFLSIHADERDPEPQPEPQLIPYVPLFERSQRKRGTVGERHWTQTARPMLQRVDEMKRLNAVRGGHWTNRRHVFLLYYSTAQRVIGYAKFGGGPEATKLVKEIALRRTLRMNATLADPLPKYEVEEMFDTMPKKPQRSETVSMNLGVTMNDVAAGLKQLVPVEMMKRQAEMKIGKQNAKKRAEALLDHLVLNGAPVTCIVKLTGKSRATVSRYIAAVAERGVELMPRTSLRGR